MAQQLGTSAAPEEDPSSIASPPSHGGSHICTPGPGDTTPSLAPMGTRHTCMWCAAKHAGKTPIHTKSIHPGLNLEHVFSQAFE